VSESISPERAQGGLRTWVRGLGTALGAAYGFWWKGVSGAAGILALTTLACTWYAFVNFKALAGEVDASVTQVAGIIFGLIGYLALAALYRVALSAQRPKTPELAPGPLGFQAGRLEAALVAAGLLREVLLLFIAVLLSFGVGAFLVGVGAVSNATITTPQQLIDHMGPALPVFIAYVALAAALMIWLSTRLSLALVASAAERRVQVLSTMVLTKGRFWQILVGQAILRLPAVLVMLGAGSLLLQPWLAAHVGDHLQDVRALLLIVTSTVSTIYLTPVLVGFEAHVYERAAAAHALDTKSPA
jgi:hypothetical protein